MNRCLCATLLLTLVAGVSPVAAQSARVRYERALEREGGVRRQLDQPGEVAPNERADLLREVTRVVAAYEGIVRRYPTNGYVDNALWQGAGLAEAAYRRFGRADDRGAALQLYGWLIREYPSSPFIRRARTQVAGLERALAVEDTLPPAAVASAPDTAPPPTVSAGPAAVLTGIQRSILPEAVRVTLELDREVRYSEERIADPDRVFFDLAGVELAPPLLDAVLSYSDDIVRQVRTGRHPNDTVRVVVDLEGVSRYSVFTLYNPFRLVVDFTRAPGLPVRTATVTPPSGSVVDPRNDAARPDAPMPEREDESARPAPSQPSSNGTGGFSLSRQLGLGVSRIVIDPGHGGHDPGASAHGLKEAELTLDVALRLETLLQQEPGVEVVLTRRTNAYVPLEERTAIANRESADLFLSIHANASRNTAAHGVETYYLSFASSPEAEAVAARENSASERAMHNLPDIIKAIALNNKLDESRDLAAMVQESMITRLRRSNRNVRNLGVKKAPFVVLIGAGMPSVLAEMSFLTNRQEAQLLKTTAYKQRIAESLHDAVMKYRSSLKRQSTVADRP